MWNASFKLTLFGCVIYICCVVFAFLDVVCDELNNCAWNLGFTNSVGTGGVLDVCLCFGYGGMVGVGGECVDGLDQGRERWGGIMSV